jgi:tRNA threonylcarbamoyladenosine biosynthesis protein TsaE
MALQLQWQTQTFSQEDTERLAMKLGVLLKGGEVIELSSDLGGGKTAFTRGLARGIGSSDRVSSPSFTLRNEYRGTRLLLYHFDFYRLEQPGIMSQELDETMRDSQAVTVIEWASIIEELLPIDHLTVQFTNIGETSRRLQFNYPESLSYIIPKEGAQKA